MTINIKTAIEIKIMGMTILRQSQCENITLMIGSMIFIKRHTMKTQRQNKSINGQLLQKGQKKNKLTNKKEWR